MTEGGAFPVDFLMLICAAVGVARAFEAQRIEARGIDHAVARVLIVGVLALNATGGAEHWREWLYGMLMPLGAYYLGRVLAAPIAAYRAPTKVDS